MDSSGEPFIRFGVFELDTRSGELRKQGRRIRLPEQAFQILSLLLDRAGQVVTRDDLRKRLWPTATAGDFDGGLNNAMRKLRDALGDSADAPRFIETLPRHGYRFLAPVTAPDAGSAPAFEPVAERAPPAVITPPRSRVVLWSAAGLLLVILVAAGVEYYQRGGLAAGRSGIGAEQIRSLVVLPFENLTGDATQDYFVDSVTDAVTTHLTQVAGLDVISRTSARQFKQTDKRLPEIGTELNVDGVVEGTVVRSGTGVRITATLIRAATDRNVWSQTYEGELSHIIPLQQRIASDLAVAAGRTGFQPEAGRVPRAIDPEAYDVYIRGLTAKGLQRHEGFSRAVAYFEEAVAIQPDFGEAYAELALTQLQFLFGGPLSPRETIPKAETAARKALSLDDTLGQAHWALGQILNLYYWRWEDGHRELQRAAELPGDRGTAISASLIRHGRFDEALVAAERGRRLDPLSLDAQLAVGVAYRATGQYDRAIDELHRALAMSPAQPRVRFQFGVTFVALGRLDDAIRELETAARPAHGHNSRIEAYLGYAYAAAGRPQDARAVLKELESHRREQYVSSFGIALIHDALGDKEAALTALQRAYEDRAVEFALMAQYPAFKAIASERLFQAVMRHVGLPR